MNSSTELKNLFEALAKAQAEMPTAGLNAANPFFKSKYANLPELVKASRPVLTKNGLSVIQGTHENDGKILLFTRLCHISGEWIESVMSVLPTKPGIQEIGKEMSYLRRYQYACITGVVATDDPDDDDGESAMQSVRPSQSHVSHQNRSTNENVVGVISNEQLDQLVIEIQKLPQEMRSPTVAQIASFNKIRVLSELRQDQFEGVMRSIRSKLK